MSASKILISVYLILGTLGLIAISLVHYSESTVQQTPPAPSAAPADSLSLAKTCEALCDARDERRALEARRAELEREHDELLKQHDALITDIERLQRQQLQHQLEAGAPR